MSKDVEGPCNPCGDYKYKDFHDFIKQVTLEGSRGMSIHDVFDEARMLAKLVK